MTNKADLETAARETQSESDFNLRAPGAKLLCTNSGYKFFLRHFQILDFFFFTVGLATKSDRARHIAAKALASGSTDSEFYRQWQDVQSNPHPSTRKLYSFSNYQQETMVTRAVDNFVCYLSETLQSCMLKRPEILKSSEQVKLEDVLRFSTKRDLIEFLVNRKLNELTYSGFSGIATFFEQKLGITIIDEGDLETRRQIGFGIELRNIYTHNRGIVNETFLKRVGEDSNHFGAKEGERFNSDLDFLAGMMNTMFDTAKDLDKKTASKYRLRTKRFATWDSARRNRIENKKFSDDYDD